MGAITIEKANNLFWLGRYIERVYTTTLHYMHIFDCMLDKEPTLYIDYCHQLEIPNIYLNDAHFLMSYLYDKENSDSIVSNPQRAYDNAIVLRDEISSKVLSYIQMGVNLFEEMSESDAPVLSLQNVIDDLLAFKGSMYEFIDDDITLDIIKLGEYVERIDLYLRLHYSQKLIDTLKNKLLDVSNKLYNETILLHQLNIDSINDANLVEFLYSINYAFMY